MVQLPVHGGGAQGMGPPSAASRRPGRDRLRILQQPLPRVRAGELPPDLADARDPDARARPRSAAHRWVPEGGDVRGGAAAVADARRLWGGRSEGRPTSSSYTM